MINQNIRQGSSESAEAFETILENVLFFNDAEQLSNRQEAFRLCRSSFSRTHAEVRHCNIDTIVFRFM
jgi:hypothetical protein